MKFFFSFVWSTRTGTKQQASPNTGAGRIYAKSTLKRTCTTEISRFAFLEISFLNVLHRLKIKQPNISLKIKNCLRTTTGNY
jgi:hypothetical protein